MTPVGGDDSPSQQRERKRIDQMRLVKRVKRKSIDCFFLLFCLPCWFSLFSSVGFPAESRLYSFDGIFRFRYCIVVSSAAWVYVCLSVVYREREINRKKKEEKKRWTVRAMATTPGYRQWSIPLADYCPFSLCDSSFFVLSFRFRSLLRDVLSLSSLFTLASSLTRGQSQRTPDATACATTSTTTPLTPTSLTFSPFTIDAHVQYTRTR